MAIVDGLNRVYNDIEVRKLKTDLNSIKIGDIVSAKIIEKLGDRDIILRLQEGWNFRGELSEDLKNLKEGLLKFKVLGFEDGKLKLKILNDNETPVAINNNTDFKHIIESSGFSSKDIELIKTLLKHNIDLNKENIDLIKSIIEFKKNGNDNSINEFVEKYLNAKGITSNNENFENIKNNLTSSLKTIINMSEEEIFFFLENGLNLNEETFEQFNKIFKENGEFLKNILNFKNDKTLNENLVFSKLNELEKEQLKNSIKEFIEINSGKNLKANKINLEELLKGLTNNIQEKLTDTDIKFLKSMDLKEIIKFLEKNSIDKINNSDTNNINKEDNKQILVEKNVFNKEIVQKDKIDVLKILNKVNNKDELEQGLINLIKDLPKEKIEKLNNYINKMIDGTANKEETLALKQLTLKGEDTIKLISSLNNKESLNLKEVLSKVSEKEFLVNQKNITGDDVKDIIKNKLQEVKDCIRDLANGDALKIPNEFIKQTRLFNDISKEYYYMDVPFNFNDEEYGAGIIIKDNRKDGKKIDSKNVKIVVTVDTTIMGKIEGYLVLNNENMNITIKAFDPWNKILNSSKQKLSAAISKLGYNVLVNVEEKKENVDIAKCNEFFNDNEIGVLNTLV